MCVLAIRWVLMVLKVPFLTVGMNDFLEKECSLTQADSSFNSFFMHIHVALG